MKKYLIPFCILLSQNATAWPIFTVPSYEEMKIAGQTSACENNPEKFRIKANARIPVQNYNHWPALGWAWTTNTQSPCLPKNQPLNTSKIDISYVRDPIEYWVLYSEITAHLLVQNGKTFSLHLKTAEDHWFCILEKQLKNYLTCANDTLTPAGE